MSTVFLESLDDPRLDPYRSLKETNETRWKNQFIVEGETLVERMVDSGWPILSVLAASDRAQKWEARLSEDVPLYVLPAMQIRTLVGYSFHRGVLACGQRPQSPSLDGLDSRLRGHGSVVIAICIDIHDPVNVGAILRTSRTLGIDAVLLSPQCADPFSRRVMRTSMGAPFDLPIAILGENAIESLNNVRTNYGFALAATVVDSNATPLDRFEIPRRLAVLFGSEGMGLSPDVAAQCDHRVTIPMAEIADSLNVAVAAGIVLWEIRRRTGVPG